MMSVPMKLTGPSSPFITHDASIDQAHFTCHCNALAASSNPNLIDRPVHPSARPIGHLSCLSLGPFHVLFPSGEPFFSGVATCNFSSVKAQGKEEGTAQPRSAGERPDLTASASKERQLLLEFKIRLRRHHDPHTRRASWVWVG